MDNSKKLSLQQEKYQKLWSDRWDRAKSLGLEKGRKPKHFSEKLKHRLYRAHKKLPRQMEKGGKHAYENVNGNYYKYTSIKINPKEAYALRKKGHTVYKDRLIVNSSIDYKPTLHRKYKDRLTGKKGLAIVYRETGSGSVTRVSGSNYRVNLIGSSFSIKEFIRAVEAGRLPEDKRINYSVSIGNNSPFKRVFNNPYQLLWYLGIDGVDYPDDFEPRTPLGCRAQFKSKDKLNRIEPLISISVYGNARMKPLKSVRK